MDASHGGSKGWSRGFWSLIGTQALGAFSDNARKGLVASLGITRVPAAGPGRRARWNVLAELAEQLEPARVDRVLRLAIVGCTYFWFLGALLLFAIVSYGKDALGVGEGRTGLLQAAVGLGLGLGSFVAGRVSGQKIEYGLIPLGALGLTGFALGLAWPGLSYATAWVGLVALGSFAGFFIVPINALLQHRPPAARKGGVIAAASLFSAIGLAAGFALCWAATALLGLTARGLFGLAGLLTLAGTVYVMRLLPDAFLRFGLWLLTHTLYRVRVRGREHVPAQGGALLVCNHLSFVDVALLSASSERPIRFVMHRDFFEMTWLRPFARLLGAIPIAGEMRPRELIGALHSAGEAVRQGDLVCIFAEGQISRIGQLLPFARGLERIMRGVEAPIVPVCLDGVWGSLFSFSRGRFFWKVPERPLAPVTVSYGPPLAPTTPAVEVRQAVQELLSDA